MESNCKEYTLSDDLTRIDAIAVHVYLTWSYWAERISRELVKRRVVGSLCSG
jgi:hypothetical protein